MPYDADEERRKNALTEHDREEIAQKVFEKFQAEFFHNVGKGVWRMVWRAIILGLIVLAIYGSGGNSLFK